MRPIRLELSGFAAFRERVEIDFEDVDFFALVGPTGSGKSTIIDAICFALYGSVPRYDDNRRVGFVVTTGASEARISLTFDIGAKRYIATRVVRRKPDGGAVTKEARLERQVDGEETEALAGTSPEVEAAVAKLIGLPFDHFTRCVVLPQGEFARFLHDKPSDRQELLVRLLNLKIYEHVGERARQLASDLTGAVETHQLRFNDLAFATEEAKGKAASRVTDLGKLRADFNKAKPRIETLESAADTSRQEAMTARDLLGSLRKVSVPANVVSLARRLAEERASLVTAEKELANNDAEVKRITKQIQSKPKLATLQLTLAAHTDLAACRDTLVEATKSLEAARVKEGEAAKGVKAAKAALEAARVSVEERRNAHASHALANTLRAGVPCPVCQQMVTVVPKRKVPSALRDAEIAEEKASEVLKEADHKRDIASQKRAGAESTLKSCEKRVAALNGQIASGPVRSDLESLIARIEAMEKELEGARDGGSALRESIGELREDAKEIEAKLRGFDQAFNRQRDALVALGPPAPKRTDLATDWQALAVWAEKQVPSQEKRTETAAATAREKDSKREGELTALRGRCNDLGIPVQKGIPTLGVFAEAILTADLEAKGELDKITAAITESKRLEGQIRTKREEAEVSKMLGQLLSAKGFEQWLVSEAVQRLVEGASSTLKQLSAGQYSLCADEKGEFMVVDHRNADETRSAKTLSGGETFQASLALALALADQLVELASEGASSLESMFLDEGFGTLDPDALVIAGDTIENTRASGSRVPKP